MEMDESSLQISVFPLACWTQVINSSQEALPWGLVAGVHYLPFLPIEWNSID
jgi:hypothetical protein